MAYDPTGGWPTISEVTKQLNASGDVQDTVELLSETNEILDDMPFLEANESTSHLHTIDNSLPSGTWRKLNYGIRPKKGSTAQVKDSIGILEQRSEVDLVLARMAKDQAKYRMKEDRRILEGLNQQLADTLFYGDTTVHPERYLGLEPRYDSLGNPSDKPTANTLGMNHVISCGGSTSSKQASVWLIGWGESSVFGIFPKNSPSGGIERQDLGEIDCRDEDGGVFRGLSTHYRISTGLAVADWRYIVRICNVEVSALIDEAAIDALVDNMIDATNAIPNLRMCRPCFYMNRAVKSRFQKAMFRKSNMAITLDEVYGVQNQLNISGIPLKQCDALLTTESVVSA